MIPDYEMIKKIYFAEWPLYLSIFICMSAPKCSREAVKAKALVSQALYDRKNVPDVVAAYIDNPSRETAKALYIYAKELLGK